MILTRDSKLDIAVANSGTGSVGIFLGEGNGDFGNMIIYSIGSGSNPQFIVVGDLNNDTLLDIVVVTAGDGNAIVLKGSGNGSFSLETTYSIGKNFDPCSIAIGDFDNDNKSDIAITNNGTNSIVILTAYSVYLSIYQWTYFTGNNSAPNSVTAGDFNNDRYLDIVVANSNTDNICVFLNLGNGTFGRRRFYSTAQSSGVQFVSVGDFNNDTQLDIAVAMSGVSELMILLGYGNGTFRYGQTYSTGAGSSPFSINIGDFNKDGDLDIATANYGTSNVGILLGHGDGTFTNIITYPVNNSLSPTSVGIGDLNSDNILDIVTTNADTGGIVILLGYGNGSFFISMIIPAGNDNPLNVAVGDLNNDHRLDIVYSSPTTSIVGVLLGTGNGTFARITKHATGTESFPLGAVRKLRHPYGGRGGGYPKSDNQPIF